MKKLAFTLALPALPAIAFAAGIDLTWDQCVGGNPATAKTFNCALNTSYDLHFQFKLDAPMPNFVALTAFVDYQNASQTPLSPFWHFEQGGCQMTPTTKGIAIFDDNRLAPLSCANEDNGGAFLDPWNGDGTGGTESIEAYGVDFRRPGNGYFVLVDYRPDLAGYPLVGQRNYWAWRLSFRTANRAVCVGCVAVGIINWQRGTLEANDGSPAVNLDIPDKVGHCVTINGDSPNNCGVVPVRNTTWGQLKSMYR